MPGTDAIHAIPFAPGQVFAGRYQLVRQLGEGGFGAVYEARQVNTGRTVALKLLHPELVRLKVGRDRFVREAKLAQAFEHPNIVRLYDFGENEQGLPFIVFELLRGQPLDALLRQSGALPVERVARIGKQVLKALMEAHALGVIHRDIKPSNIFVGDFHGEPDFVKVLDFGVAKPMAPSSTDGTALTREGQMVGTPSYMAPEQVLETPVSPATDLYSLGLVLAECINGDVVFKGRTGGEVCVMQASPNPAPLSPAVLSSPLGSVIQRATQKNSQHRFSSAQEMLQALEAAGQGGGAAVAPPTPGYAPQAQQVTPPPGSPPAGWGAPPQQNWGQAGTPQPSTGDAAAMSASGGAPRKGLSTLWIVLLVVFGFGVVALGLGGFFIWKVAQSFEQAVGGAALEAVSNPGTQASDPPSGSDAELDLRPQLEAAGWKLLSEPQFYNQSTIQTATFVVQKGDSTAAVTVYIYRQFEGLLPELEKSLKSSGAVVRRRGSSVLAIHLTQGSEDPDALADQLLH